MRRAVLVVAVAGALAFAASAGTASANVRYPVLGCWRTMYGGGNWNLQFKPSKCTMVTDPPGGPVCDDYGWLSNIAGRTGVRHRDRTWARRLCHLPTLTLTLKAYDRRSIFCGKGSAYERVKARVPRVLDLRGEVVGPFTMTFDTAPVDAGC